LPSIYAITQFHFTIPEEFENSTGIIFSADVNSRNYSWIDDGLELIPYGNNTPNIQADDSDIDLDANEYLFAIDQEIDIGTRVYMCLAAYTYLDQPICQTDAIDKSNLARSIFQFNFK